MPLVVLLLYSVLNMFRMLIHPSSGVCDLFVELFRGLYCSGSMCVGVTLWFGCGGVVSVCRLKHSWCYVVVWLWWCGIRMQASACWSLHTDTTPPQPNHNVTPIHIEPDTTHEVTQRISRKFLRMDVLTSETCWALNKVIIKQVVSSWSLFTQHFTCSNRNLLIWELTYVIIIIITVMLLFPV